MHRESEWKTGLPESWAEADRLCELWARENRASAYRYHDYRPGRSDTDTYRQGIAAQCMFRDESGLWLNALHGGPDNGPDVGPWEVKSCSWRPPPWRYRDLCLNRDDGARYEARRPCVLVWLRRPLFAVMGWQFAWTICQPQHTTRGCPAAGTRTRGSSCARGAGAWTQPRSRTSRRGRPRGGRPGMGAAEMRYREMRFALLDGMTEAYVLVEGAGDCPGCVPGWRHRTYPSSVGVVDIIESWLEAKECPVLWERCEAPPAAA